MTNDQLITINKLYNDCWKLIKEFHNAKTDEEWKNCTARAGELMEKYGKWSMNIILDTEELVERGVK